MERPWVLVEKENLKMKEENWKRKEKKNKKYVDRPSYTTAGRLNGTTNVENCSAVSYKVKYTSVILFWVFTLEKWTHIFAQIVVQEYL